MLVENIESRFDSDSGRVGSDGLNLHLHVFVNFSKSAFFHVNKWVAFAQAKKQRVFLGDKFCNLRVVSFLGGNAEAFQM